MSPSAVEGAGRRLEATLERLRAEKRVGLMTHIVYGFPTVEDSETIVATMVRSGVDLIEVQLPFSDPTADGPTITQACQVALDGGARIHDGVEFVARMAAEHDVPFLFMSYFNIVFNYRDPSGGERGVEAFVKAAARAGAAGLIVPDIPPEEKQERFPELCREHGLHPIYVTSPNVSPGRLEAIARVSSGMLYCTSRTGTTGKDIELEVDRLGAFLATAREVCGLPVAVGFSISRREQVEAVGEHADVAVVGSHLLRTYEQQGVTGLEQELAKLRGR